MKLGVSLPTAGSRAAPDAIARVGCAGEDVGYASLRVLERLLCPLQPEQEYCFDPRGPAVERRLVAPEALRPGSSP